MYTYKMIQIPPTIAINGKIDERGAAAAYLQHTVNTEAENGWEFQRIDTFSVDVQAGCFGALFGKKSGVTSYYVITFRKPV